MKTIDFLMNNLKSILRKVEFFIKYDQKKKKDSLFGI